MSFSITNPNLRKENVSFLAKKSNTTHNPQIIRISVHNANKLPIASIRRTSACTSDGNKGSMTIEAALAIPLFFLALLCLVFLLEITAIQIRVKSGMHSAAKALAQEAYVLPFLIPSNVESDIVQSIGADRLDRSMVVGGSGGLDCSDSYIMPGTAVIHLTVRYKVKLPIPKFGLSDISFIEKVRMKGWTGYVKGGFDKDDSDIVYITDTASVYHKDYHCTHLDLSIEMVSGGSVVDMRNEYQEKYHACSKCAHGIGSPTGAVYITGEGNCYHTSLSCSGLKRKVYAVPLSQVIGKGACSRCGQ